MNWLHSFFCVGSVLIVSGATLAFRRAWTWQQVSFAMAILPATVAVLFLFVGHPELRQVSAGRSLMRKLLTERYFLLSLGAIFLAGGAEMGIAQWLPAYAELELGFSRWVGGASLLAFSIAMALGRMGAGVLSGRMPVQRLMAWSCGAAALSILLAGISSHAALSLGASIASGLTMSCLWPSTLGVAADRFPSAGASLFGVLSAVGNLGGVFVPWMVGVLGDTWSIGIGLATSALCPVLVLFILSAMGKVSARAPEPVPA